MTRSKTDRPSVGDIFRHRTRDRGTGLSTDTPAPRGPRVLLSIHHDCAVCDRWVRKELGAQTDELRRWSGRGVRLDPEGDVGKRAAWIAVVDEWDEVFHVAPVAADHAFPDPAELVEWVRFVAIQCPECESPEGPWRR